MERTVLVAVTERPGADSALAGQLRRVCTAMDGLGPAGPIPPAALEAARR